jgi:hypothetical protein
MKITKKQSIADRFAKAFIKGDGSISLKDLISDEKEDMESVLKALLEQQNLSEEQKKQLLQIIKVTKKTTRGLRDLDELQQEAFDQAREQGKSIFQSLKAADKLKEDYEAATTGMRSRFGKIVTAFGGSEELAQVADLVFGKRVSKEERKELAEKFKVKKEKKTKTKAARGDAQQTQQQTATKKPRGRIDPATGEFVRTDFGSKVLQQEKDPFAPVLSAISETPKVVDELIEEENLQEDIKKILESVGEKKQPFDVHDKLNLILKAVSADALSDLLDIGGGGDGKRKRRRRGPVGRRGGGVGRFGVGSLLGGAAVGGLAYMAVDSFRDPDLVSEDPEFLKEQASMAETPEEKQEIQEQITAQKTDVKIQAAATGAGIAGAVGGAVAVTKIAQTKTVQKVKNKTWDLFMGFLKKRAPKLFAQVGVRLAAAGGLAVIPFVGWISAAVTVVGSLWLAYDLYKLWKEFSALSEAEQELYADDIEKKADAEVQAAPTTSPTSIEPAPAATSFPNAAGTTSSMAPPTTAPAVAPIRVSSSMPGAIPPAETGASAEDLKKYVRLKDSSINLDGLNSQMKERLAGLAKEYFNKTGQKIQINSGYRSPEEQAALFAKYGAPRAAPPGRSRHESGLAIDINSTDANKAIELGLMAKYGFTRPVPGETWHVEPIETAKRGATPDNPYKPGAPIVASNNGNEIDPKSGRAPSSGIASPPAKQAEMGTAVAAAPPRTETPGVAASVTAPPAVTATPISPTPVTGAMVAQQTTAVTSAKEEMMVSAAPTVVPVPVGGQSQGAKPMPPSNAVPASTRDSESSFARALAKDFAHPSAFTTIGTV